MKTFLCKLLLFVLPAAILFYPVLCSGEMANGGIVAVLQHVYNIPIIYGPLYSETQYQYYKAAATQIREPEVLVIGDSRSLQIHDFFFKEDVNMYNAGYCAITTADIQYFLETCKGTSSVNTVIFPLSHFSFNENYQDVFYPDHNKYSDYKEGVGSTFSQVVHRLYEDIQKGTLTLADYYGIIKNTNAVGLNAKFNGNGILNSGAYYYGKTYSEEDNHDSTYRIQDTLTRIKNANMRFEHGETASPSAIYYLREFLNYCEENEIYVISYAPPYAPSVNHAMEAKGEAYGYQEEMLRLVPEIFAEYSNAEFFDYTDISFLGCNDDYFIDGFHGGDVAFTRMFVDMISKGSRLKDLCDINALREYDRNRYSDLVLFSGVEEYIKQGRY